MNEHLIHATSKTIIDPHKKGTSHETIAKDLTLEDEEKTVREMAAEGWEPFFRNERATGHILRLFSRRNLF